MIDLASLKKSFLDKRFLILQKMKNTEPIDLQASDEGDHAQNQLIKSMVKSLADKDLNSLNKINQALSRLEKGTYGYCENCEELISEKRLLALPDVLLCIDCAEDEERELRNG